MIYVSKLVSKMSEEKFYGENATIMYSQIHYNKMEEKVFLYKSS